jgi:SAM-dependent methyltransferase
LWLRFEREARACPACGSDRIVLLDAFKIPRDRRGRRVAFLTGCHGCGLLFANPLPSPADLERQYAEGGAWATTRKVRASKPPVRRPDARDPRDVLLEALTPYVPITSPPAGSKVIDFGCGDGKFLDRLQSYGWETYGIEPSTSVAFERHRRLDEPPGDGTFDLAILHHVLEHITNPLDVLSRLASALRPGGVLFIGVPRLDTLPEHHDFKYCLDGRHHVECLSAACLEALLARAGFRITARLVDRALDEEITQGKALRLRIVASRTMEPVPAPDAPLTTAIAALRAFRKSQRTGLRLDGALPVRMRAAFLDRTIERRARARRRERERSAAPSETPHGERTGG